MILFIIFSPAIAVSILGFYAQYDWHRIKREDRRNGIKRKKLIK